MVTPEVRKAKLAQVGRMLKVRALEADQGTTAGEREAARKLLDRLLTAWVRGDQRGRSLAS